MNDRRRTVLLDFDGTLAERPGLWSGCLLEILDEHLPAHGATRESIKRHLRHGFPWHRPDEPHPELCESDRWWSHVGETLASAFRSVEGVDSLTVPVLVRAFRDRYCDPAGFRLFPDTTVALEMLRDAGYRLVVLSNHVPELATIVAGLGLHDLVDEVVSSAIIGYEKPHPEAFRAGLGDGDAGQAWMVGDNVEADVRGAEAFGMSAVLVRETASGVRHQAVDLVDAATLIISG